jgi:chorismate mutase/prephenate dehydratase
VNEGTPRETGERRQELLQEVARLDAKLVAVLEERARLGKQLRDLRRNQPPAIPVADHAALQDLVDRSSGDMPKESLRAILRAVFAAGLALELPVKVAYVGPDGGGGFGAARGRFGSEASMLVATDSAVDALEEVSRKRAEFAVVPFETSSEGPLRATIQALMNRDLRIAEMLADDSPLHLVGRAATLDGVTKIYGTAADHALCRRFLERLPSTVALFPVASPRHACELAAGESGAAAIAAEAIASAFDLGVVTREVRDDDSPRVRYAVAGTRPSARTTDEATSFVFSVQDTPGSLLDVLRVFADRGIRLTKIHSHPSDGTNWSYLFYAEAAGHFTDRSLVTAFEEIKRVTRSFKLLGSYPSG